MVLNILLVNKI